ncbi:ankyrin repeat and KH domain-containing protein mask-like [Haliotis rubra]|uniref:ankyrin repeat and KH domain-containing protein mask-like n=1 Tax=Haliotis rubra TaxID=36100 RepID=UPI001EE63003|nr:ankyrin repeat and KH domain-containing protein mask-like [Haliotis rubra]
MSNPNNENNPPESCTKEIHVKPNTEGHTETVNAAGIAHGGVGNTNINVVQAQGDKELVEEEVPALVQNLNQYGDDVQDEKKKIADLQRMIQNIEVEQAKQRRQFEDERREREELQRQMQRIEDEQAKQKRQCEDLRRENTDLRREIREFQSQIQNLHEVIEEKDNDIRQLKDLRTAAAESKVQEPQDAVQETTTKDKHGREEGKTVTQKDSNPRHVDALLAACRGGNMAEVKRVLDLGQVDINFRGRGWGSLTPVMEAALGGHREVMELLLSRGADVSLVDKDGNNTLHLACHGGDVGAVELILSQDVVDVNARNNRGQTAADMARGRGQHQLADLLVSCGAR